MKVFERTKLTDHFSISLQFSPQVRFSTKCQVCQKSDDTHHWFQPLQNTCKQSRNLTWGFSYFLAILCETTTSKAGVVNHNTFAQARVVTIARENAPESPSAEPYLLTHSRFSIQLQRGPWNFGVSSTHPMAPWLVIWNQWTKHFSLVALLLLWYRDHGRLRMWLEISRTTLVVRVYLCGLFMGIFAPSNLMIQTSIFQLFFWRGAVRRFVLQHQL